MPAASVPTATAPIPPASNSGSAPTGDRLPAVRLDEDRELLAALVSPPSLAAAGRLPDADLKRLAQALHSSQPILWEERVEAAIIALDEERLALLTLPPDWVEGIATDPLDNLLDDINWVEALKQAQAGCCGPPGRPSSGCRPGQAVTGSGATRCCVRHWRENGR